MLDQDSVWSNSVLQRCFVCFAQQSTGALKGTVTDQLGSLVVGAKVTVRNARGVTTMRHYKLSRSL